MPRILLIDDSPSALETIEMILVDAGHQVTACTDGNHAIRMQQQEFFDLVITDIYMPDRDGLEVIREIGPDVPIVAISGKTGPFNILNLAKYLGASQTVQKPFSRAELLMAVERALSKPASRSSEDRGSRE